MPYRPHRGAQILFIVFACYSLESLSSVQRLEKEKKTSYTQLRMDGRIPISAAVRRMEVFSLIKYTLLTLQKCAEKKISNAFVLLYIKMSDTFS